MGTFTINYADGTHVQVTQAFSDWYAGATASGEVAAATMAYRDSTATGGPDTRFSGSFYLYEYTIPLIKSKVVSSITLPVNTQIKILSMDLVS